MGELCERGRSGAAQEQLRRGSEAQEKHGWDTASSLSEAARDAGRAYVCTGDVKCGLHKASSVPSRFRAHKAAGRAGSVL